MKVPDTNKIISLAYIAAMLIVVYLIYKIFAGIGIIKTGAKKKQLAAQDKATEELRALTYFDPAFLSGKLSSYTPLKSAKTGLYVNQIHKAIRGWGTDEESLYSVFEKLTKWNISEVALNYYKEYQSDMLADILSELTPAEKVTLLDIIDKQPVK